MAGKRGSSKPSGRSKSTGIFSSMRGGMRSLTGQGSGKKKKMTFWDVLLWILVGILAIWVIYKKFL